MPKIALGHRREASDPGCLRAVLGELVLTFLFVFVGVGSAIVGGQAVAAGGDTSAALIAVALGHALVVAVFATAGFHISGAHMNPAVTLSLAVGGHITLIRAGFFVLAQMLGSSLACILLRALTGGLARS
ncbi:Aquaporin TIP4-3 [Triticum urartu]|uniref:Aquaporin TIP4-3 n=1 Tax=Triticum urartu TaxID=4572 RepID=M7ZH47_TRIUA|nr:Aquaporin TIP4-3 [Triticum urartu]